jgi:hypothetical protein
MADDVHELPMPLNRDSAAQYVADDKGIDVSELTYTGQSPAGSYGFRQSNGDQHTLHTPIGRKDGVIITS